MRFLFLLLSICAVAVGADLQNRVGYTSGVYNNSYEMWTLRCTIVQNGKLPPGTTVWIYSAVGSNWWWGTVPSSGDLTGTQFNINTENPHNIPTGQWFNINIGVLDSIGANDVQPVTWHRYQRANAEGNMGGAPKNRIYDFTFMIYGDTQRGRWNIELHSKTHTAKLVEYIVKWADEPTGHQVRMPPANPRQLTVFNFFKDGQGEDITARAFTVFRRIAGGSWQSVYTGSCPANQTIILTDDPMTGNETPPEGGETNPPPISNVQDGGGKETGEQTGPSTNPYTGPGGNNGNNGGDGNNGNGGTGGSGSGDNNPDQGTPGSAPTFEGETDNDNTEKTALRDHAEDYANTLNSMNTNGRNLLSAADALGSRLANPQLPTVSAASWDYKIPLKIQTATVQVDLSAYQSLFQWLRRIILAVITWRLWQVTMKLTTKIFSGVN